jgi:hypothetical protein
MEVCWVLLESDKQVLYCPSLFSSNNYEKRKKDVTQTQFAG